MKLTKTGGHRVAAILQNDSALTGGLHTKVSSDDRVAQTSSGTPFSALRNAPGAFSSSPSIKTAESALSTTSPIVVRVPGDRPPKNASRRSICKNRRSYFECHDRITNSRTLDMPTHAVRASQNNFEITSAPGCTSPPTRKITP